MIKVAALVMGFLVFFSVLSPNITYAMCGMCTSGSSHEHKHKEEEIINEECPVMGEEVDEDTPYKIDYKGKTIGFCCASCVEKFNAEPEKYMKKIEGEDTEQGD